jgi:hypothetical protein
MSQDHHIIPLPLAYRAHPHHAKARLRISLPCHISFTANIARKRPDLNRGKCNRARATQIPEALSDQNRNEIPLRFGMTDLARVRA